MTPHRPCQSAESGRRSVTTPVERRQHKNRRQLGAHEGEDGTMQHEPRSVCTATDAPDPWHDGMKQISLKSGDAFAGKAVIAYTWLRR